MWSCTVVEVRLTLPEKEATYVKVSVMNLTKSETIIDNSTFRPTLYKLDKRQIVEQQAHGSQSDSTWEASIISIGFCDEHNGVDRRARAKCGLLNVLPIAPWLAGTTCRIYACLDLHIYSSIISSLFSLLPLLLHCTCSFSVRALGLGLVAGEPDWKLWWKSSSLNKSCC